MNALGIDLSTHAIDLVLLDENADRAQWTRLDLGTHKSAFERVRQVPEVMPQPGWYESHGVYLAALERPMGQRHGQDLVRLVQGAVLACLPSSLLVWEVLPAEWKRELGLKQADKPSWGDFPAALQLHCAWRDPPWVQDALDALGLAWYARETNARDVAKALGRTA